VTPALPLNAAPIVAARLKGMKPQEMIRVSLVGSLVHGNHVVHAKTDIAHDWRWVHDLDICLCIGAEHDWAPTLKEIALHRPEHLSVWNTYEHWGAKVYLVPTKDDIEQCRPVSDWEYELDLSEWMGFQNDDFLSGRTYARNQHGVPYAVHS
jgi:hypothetical protein